MNPYKDTDLQKFLEKIPQDVIERETRLQLEGNKREYQAFVQDLGNDKCYLCNGKLSSFEEQKPCFHWFTYPSGIRKKNFESYLKQPVGFFRLESYFRWLANIEKPIGNINDLKADVSSTSYLETTIRYKNIEWAFSIGHTDMEGHKAGKVGSLPHYHIQMMVDGRIFLKFNDFHIPFSDEDLFQIELLRQAGDKVKLEHIYGHGIGLLEDSESLEIIDKAMKVSEDETNATFRTQTFIQPPQGQTISGKIIAEAMEESKRTKEPISNILQRLLTDAKFTKIISPGSGVPKMSKRSGKK
ncbi:hypothetical protein [uncultured Pontibacter sp.]|uniref:hypothetical protein n=1 Tax=uncultured Pontibacter sp. TaxID=453356 RepID=UPI002609F684|nr:hypothetical protein [uncultured Pontibacter sp.]